MLVSRGIAAIAAPLMVIFTTAILGVAGYGRLNLLLIAPALVFSIAAQWSSAAPLTLGREEIERDGSLGRTTWSRFALIAPLFVLALAVVVIGRLAFGLYADYSWTLVLLALAQAPVLILGEHVVALLQAAGRMAKSALSEIVQRLLVIGAIGGLLAAGASTLTPVLWAMVAGAAAGAAIAVFQIGGTGFRPLVVTREEVRRMLVFSLPLVLATLGSFVVRWCDVVVIEILGTIEEVGQYAVAYQGYMALFALTVAAVSVFTPLLTSMRVAERPELVARYVTRGVPLGVLLSATAAGTCVAAVHGLLPVVLGDDFAASADPLAILILALQAVMVISFAIPVLLSHGQNRALGVLAIVAAALNIALDVALVAAIGIDGAALATVFAQFVLAALIVRVAARTVEVPVPPWAIASLPALLGVLGVLLLPTPWAYVVAPLAALAAAAALARFTSMIGPEERRFVESLELPAVVRRLLLRLVDWAGPRRAG